MRVPANSYDDVEAALRRAVEALDIGLTFLESYPWGRGKVRRRGDIWGWDGRMWTWW